MLFTSYEFVFLFLPLSCAAFFAAARQSRGLAMLTLVLASLVFYAYWRVLDLLVIGGSVAFNYAVGKRLFEEMRADRLRYLLFAGVTVNLVGLGIFKYSAFVVITANALLGLNLDVPVIVLPLGVSFFTFTQIAFLVDASRRDVRAFSPGNYALFVTYFPHLIAGPILHHKEMMPQFDDPATYRFNAERVGVGLSLFAIGLFKKLIIADGVARYSDPVFFQAANGGGLSLIEAWTGALAYSFQIYFDFSGYSDMAVGISWMFGIRLPVNFHSPYKAASIIEFWRRWHMTLSRFLRDYLYVPLGGNRLGQGRRYLNLFLTMLLGGIWHGAGWTFVMWGALHGLFLCCNHVWRQVPTLIDPGNRNLQRLGSVFAWALTFLCVTVAWVFFRADNFSSALEVIKGMAGLNGIILPENYAAKLGPVGRSLAEMGVEFGNAGLFVGKQGLLALAGVAVIAFLMPNSSQFFGVRSPGISPFDSSGSVRSRLAWDDSAAWAVTLGAAAAIAMLGASYGSPFLYFQF